MLVQTKDITISGDMPGEVEGMEVDPDSLEHIMDLLSDLYSSRTGAIVREYSTNALDAHAISGQTKPIEITTPTRLNNKLIIQDFGPGMSREDLSKVFKRYGRSTKRGNNLETGQLGLGSKSGFAYTDQFTVRSVHDGNCCEIIMSRNARGAAEMNIAFEYETDDPTGVTVTIPIKSIDIVEVQEHAKEFAKYAKPGTVKVDGVVNSTPSDWTKIADGIYSVDGAHEHKVVMGNVAYPAPLFSHTGYMYRPCKFVVYLDMGAVDFAPSRESLKMTSHTVQTINATNDKIRQALSEYITQKLSASSTRSDKAKAYDSLVKWDRYLPNGGAAFHTDVEAIREHTESISARLPYDIDDPQDRVQNYNYKTSRHWEPKRKLGIGDISRLVSNDIYAITDFPGLAINRLQARKIVTLKPEFAGKTVYFFSAPKDLLSDLFDMDNSVSWNDVLDVKVNQKPRNRQKVREGDKYVGMMVHKRQLAGSKKMMTTNGNAYYCAQSHLNEMRLPFFPREDFKLFIVPPAKQAAFAKANPHAKSLVEYINNHKQQINRHIANSKHVKEAMQWTTPSNCVRWLDLSVIKHEGLRKAVCLARTGNKWNSLSIGGGGWYGRSKFSEYTDENFPLVVFHSYELHNKQSKIHKHAVDYINMIGENNGKS